MARGTLIRQRSAFEAFFVSIMMLHLDGRLREMSGLATSIGPRTVTTKTSKYEHPADRQGSSIERDVNGLPCGKLNEQGASGEEPQYKRMIAHSR